MKLLIAVCILILLQGCALLPSMGAGAKLADEIAKNQIAFQEAIIKGSVSIDCATGWSIGARTGMTSNAKIDLAKANLLAVTDQNSKEYKACYKFGLYGALTMFEGEWTVQRLLEFLGTIN
jgi:sporulation-control protein spo0M